MTKHIYTVLLAGASFLVTACGHKEPPKDEVINAMSAVIPGQFSIKNAEVEFRPVGEVGGMAKLKMEIAPKEDLYVSADTDPKVFGAAQLNRSSSNETDALQQKAKQNGIAFSSDQFRKIQGAIARRNAFLELVNVGWIKLAAKAGTSSTVYGTVQAAYEFKEWRFSNARLDQRVDVNGQPRSAFRSSVNIVGSKEADDLAKQISDATEHLNKNLDDASKWVDDSIARKGAQEKQSLAKKKDTLFAASKAGEHYKGTYQAKFMGTSTQYSAKMDLRFTKSDPDTNLIELVLSSDGEHGLTRKFSGKAVIAEGDNNPDSIAMVSVSPIAYDRRDDGVFRNYIVDPTAKINVTVVGPNSLHIATEGPDVDLTLKRVNP